jgi:hypothetical protein
VLRLRRAVWLPLLGFLLYAAVLAWYSGPCAGGSDSSGYLNNARMLRQAQLTIRMRQFPGLDPANLPSYTYVPLGFIPNPDGKNMTPTYSMGLPLMLAAAAGIAGWNLAPGLVIGLHALFGLLLMYRLGRAFGLEPGWASMGAILLCVNSLYLMMSFCLLSDMPATLWLGAAVLCAWTSRARPQFAFAAGIALSVAVLVRPTDLLGAVPVGLALGFGLRRWLRAIAGGLPGAVFLCFVNHTAYGSIFKTGYGDVSWMFSASHVPGTILHYGHWLPVLLTPLVVLAVGLPFIGRRQPVQTAILASWALVLPVFYLFYSITHENWWCLRFILPSFPALLIASLLVARTLAARFRLPQRARWLALAIALVLVYDGVCFRFLHVGSIGRNERLYRETAAWMQEHLPADALIASMQASGALFYYTQFTFFRWDQVSPADFQRIAGACAATHTPIYAPLFPYETDDNSPTTFQKHLGSRWTRVAALRHVTIWRYDFPAERPRSGLVPEKSVE